jgi:cell wall-associated NlpC family hydrolase
MTKRNEIVAAARNWLRVPYKRVGRGRTGVDCIGLLCGVGKDIGYAPDIPSSYPPGAIDLLVEQLQLHLVKTDRYSVPQLLEADVVILLGQLNTPQHAAIVGYYGNEPTMIHVLGRIGYVTEQRWDQFWSNRIVAVYEFPNLEPVQVPAL